MGTNEGDRKLKKTAKSFYVLMYFESCKIILTSFIAIYCLKALMINKFGRFLEGELYKC